jgi:hypothetical protein
LAHNKEQRLAALSAYRDRTETLYQMLSTEHKAATVGLDEVLEAETRLLNAKIWLAEEQAKP